MVSWRGEKHISSYQSNRKWRVSSWRAKSRQILQQNVFRRLASFPASPARPGKAVCGVCVCVGGGWLAFMTTSGPAGEGSLARSFVTCLRFWDLTWPGCPGVSPERRPGAAKTNKRREKHNMLVNKELDVRGRERLLSQPGSLDLTSYILPSVHVTDIHAGGSGLMYSGKA